MIELCDDGIEYVEPDPIITPNPETYVTYEEILNNKINELSSACQHTIEAGLEINGLHYSYTEKDQINLNDIVNTVKLTGLPLWSELYRIFSRRINEHIYSTCNEQVLPADIF